MASLREHLLAHVTVESALLTVLFFEFVALLSVPSVLLKRRGRPTAALSWLFALFALPAFGSLAWWAFGRTRLERRLRRHHASRKKLSQMVPAPATTPLETVYDELLPRRARGDYAFATKGNNTKLLLSGKEVFAEMEAAMSGARICVNMLFYIFEYDETGLRICDILKERAESGVKVRVLLDGFGCQKTAHKIRAHLQGSGAEVQVFLPSRLHPIYAPRFNFINHRKILIVDNVLAFTGGMNIGEEYEKDWRDLMLKISGKAVAGLSHILLEDWYYATGQLLEDPVQKDVPDPGDTEVGVISSGPDTESWIHDSYFLAITRAEKRLYIATPYFIPPQAIATALRTAAGRGVDVRIVLPSLSDVRLVMWASRSFYMELVLAGVRIYEYRGAMLHAKALIKDDNLLSVGTANVDNRSFRLNFEVSCFTSDPALNTQLTDWFLALLPDSEEITLDVLNSKSTLRKLAESSAHLLSPLL